ncbi:purine-nucleoside phosphorylase [Buchnera aphidicola]|uniref:purine-nucleoside phosphorylase n=1 Tax=Buchnera aphidicola TaxID=9 RepID=UPI00346433A3
MSTPHIDSKKNAFSETVLMCGDPIRARYIAENYLYDAKKINNIRLMLAYTGYFKNKKVSIMSHGIGMPSAVLYVRELILEYNVKNIIRVGTCGAVSNNIKLRDILISMGACTDSNINRISFNNYDFAAIANFEILNNAVSIAKKMNIQCSVGNFFTTDLFYNDDREVLNILKKYNILGIDMETAGIYAVALELNAKALSICTVSDHIIKKEAVEVKDRESGFDNMIKIALESTLLEY